MHIAIISTLASARGVAAETKRKQIPEISEERPGWEMVVVANEKMGSIRIIHPGQGDRSQSPESQKLVQS